MDPFIAFSEKSTRLFKFIKGLFSKKNLKKIIQELTSPNQSDGLKAFSAGFGTFLGIIPIWGFQTMAAIALAVAFKLNKVLVFLFAHISFPPLLPLIIFLSYRTGSYWTYPLSKSNINHQLLQYVYGSFSLAVIAGLSVGLLTYGTLKITRMYRQYILAIKLKKAL
jgi:uncharacterized protein (DUF2062 family)